MLQGNDQWGNGKILLLPTVIVNKHQYRGRLDVPSILRALCAGFSESTEPQVGRPLAVASLEAVLWPCYPHPHDLQLPGAHDCHCHLHPRVAAAYQRSMQSPYVGGAFSAPGLC